MYNFNCIALSARELMTTGVDLEEGGRRYFELLSDTRFINISFCWPPACDSQNYKRYSVSQMRAIITLTLYSLSWIFVCAT